MNTNIISHRGIDNNNKESTRKAFIDALSNGFGIEFDIRLTKDNKFIIIHDNDLSRLTNGEINEKVQNLTLSFIKNIKKNIDILTLSEILDIINHYPNNNLSALHLKHDMQNINILHLLKNELKNKDLSKIIIFDIKKDTALFLKKEFPYIKLAPSVSHLYDMERYNKYVGYTLWNLKDVKNNKDLFYGVWLDEWDTLDKNNKEKTIYKKEIFEDIRSMNLKIFLVTPELHSTSPGLLASESHNDAKNKDTLLKRINEILLLNPDGICTDNASLIKEKIQL